MPRSAEPELGRLGPAVDVEMLAPVLIGTGHLRTAGKGPDPGEITRMVAAVLAQVLR